MRSARVLGRLRQARLTRSGGGGGLRRQGATPNSASSLRRQFAQLAEPRLVPAPPVDGRAVDWLTRLPETRGLDPAPVLMRSQTRVVPFEAAGGDEPSYLRLGIADQRLIVHLDEAVRRQNLAPVGHQPLVLPGEEDDIP